MSISVEAFMWHPHSIKYSVQDSKYAYNDQLLADMDDGAADDDCSSSDKDEEDDHHCTHLHSHHHCDSDRNHESASNNSSSSSSSGSSSVLTISLPPRMILEKQNLSATAAAAVSPPHPPTPSYDMQDVAEKWAKRRRYRIIAFGHVIACTRTKKLMFIDFIMERIRDGSVMLACVYYSPCRGGLPLRIARSYMREIQAVCNQQMEFFPRVLALCIYDSSELLQAASAFSFDSATASVFSSHCRKTKKSQLSSSPAAAAKTRSLQRQQQRRQQHQRKVLPRVYAMDVTTTV